MKIRFLEIAQIELDEAIEYYDREEPGLGSSFFDEVVSALDRIGRFPQAWPQCSRRQGAAKPDVSLMESFTSGRRRR